MLLGLQYEIWVVLILYYAFILYLGWRSKRGIDNQEGFLLGNRQFGVSMMVMHAFGAGTHPGDVAGVMSKTVAAGASGVWVSWMWMFGTPFYWLIAPILRRMRLLTVADYFQERYGKPATALYVCFATVGMTVALAGILLATTRTVQGMMGKAGPEDDLWFFSILIISTTVFMVYSFWGGIVAAIKTDMIQGLMIIALSFIAIPAALALPEVNGFAGMRAILREASERDGVAYLSLFDPNLFNFWAVVLLCINAPFSIIAQPHVMSVTSAGRTEWEGRMGFCYGNILKRVCTMGWAILGLCWMAYLFQRESVIHPDAAFGDAVKALLSPVLQGLMLACIMAAAMSTGDAVQVTVAGLFSQNVYKVYANPDATEQRLLSVTRWMGVVIVVVSLIGAIVMRQSLVRLILDYFNITSLIGVSIVMGILWRRMNQTGVFVSAILALSVFIVTRYLGYGREATIGWPLLAGILGGVAGSLLTAAPDSARLDAFYKKIYVPIGCEDRLALSLDEAVPPEKRWLTAGGLFVVKPSRESWVGFLIALAICVALVAIMYLILNA